MAEKVQETNEKSEPKTSITVICNTSREDGKGKKPQGIHLNPKFFNSSRTQGPPRRPPPIPNHDIRVSVPFNQVPPHGFRAFPPRYSQSQAYRSSGPQDAPFRPNFPPPFQGPRHRSQFFPHQFPPPPRFDWQGVPPSFQQGYSRPPPPHAPFPNEFNSEYFDPNTSQPLHQHPSEFQHQHDFCQPPPPIPWQAEIDPIPGPSYYQGFKDENSHSHGHTYPTNNKWNSGERKYSRSRSRSPSSRRHRSLSRSSAGRRSYESGERRSRSLSSDFSSKRKRRCYDSSENDGLWDSDVERNSDSDLDLSKPLDLLTSNASDSKSLLKDALKCLGSAKIETMIPTELSNISRNRLFHMCAELLDETENEKLIHIMEGKVTIKKVQPGDQLMNSTSQSCLSTSSSSESNVNTRQKSHKKKRSKRRKKKRKKERVSPSSSEDDLVETGTGLEDDNSSSMDNLAGLVDSTFSEVNKSKSRPSSGTSHSQQSLLELIQIEYKTKAINVMLKNLGVATEISSLVSNVLHTSGISAIQGVAANTDTDTSKQEEEKAESSKAQNVHNIVPDMNLDMTENDTLSDNSEKKCANESDIEGEKSECVSDDVPENETESHNEDCSKTCPTLTASPSKSKNDAPFVEEEIFKEVLDDVLDIDVGDNEEIDFLTM